MLIWPYFHGCARMVDSYRRIYARSKHPIPKRMALAGMTHYLIELDRTLQRYAQH